MQSGITASTELHAAFAALLAAPSSQRGLLAGISNEQLVPLNPLPSSSADFFTDLTALHGHLTDTSAAYILLRRYPDAPDGFVAVTYVPDAAPVRSKMLFAATRLTLVRELGPERFRETLFATTKAELTPEGWRKHDAHGEMKAPLTAEEETLQGVREAEVAAADRSTGERRQQYTKGLTSPVSEAGKAALKALPEGGENLAQLRIDAATEAIELVGTSTVALDDLPGAISATEPRYSFFKYEHTHEGAAQAPLIFISSCPSGLKVKERMLHAASRAMFLNTVRTELGLEVEKRLEVSDPSEITTAAVHEEFHPKTETKTAFARPKRPGRK